MCSYNYKYNYSYNYKYNYSYNYKYKYIQQLDMDRQDAHFVPQQEQRSEWFARY